MVDFKNKEFLVDGKPIFVLSGELHYFRRTKKEWQILLDEAKALGLNCIASYVPWILHEEFEGEYCFSDNLDLGAFIDLCHENGMMFFVRPGPFIMAEMKGEGIPYWVAEKYPDAVPIGFFGQKKATTTLDYLNAGFLYECEKWYSKIMEIIVPRLQCNGGNIIGVQLDNEVGMLQWVSNYPILTDNALGKFYSYLRKTYSTEELGKRYYFLSNGFENDLESVFRSFRNPEERYSLEFHTDFGIFMRGYYSEYIRQLIGFAKKSGVRETPFFINIHGTGGDRIYDFPLGISQLYEAYNQGDGLISGTDVYLGEPNEGKHQDLYIINALTDCMNKKGNPLTSIEFQCGDGGYSSLSGLRFHPSATSHKMLICLSQNTRLINFYLFSGGENYFLKNKREDGNHRMAFTGQEHGYSALIRPDGNRGNSFLHVAKTASAISAINRRIGSSKQILDGVSLGFIPDLFLTELSCPGSESVAEMHKNLSKWRCGHSADSIVRALLRRNISFDAIEISDDMPTNKCLIVLSARYMPKSAQERLRDFAMRGGTLIIYGEIPEYDLDGYGCNVLQDALGLSKPEYMENNQPEFFLTVASRRYPAPDHRCGSAQVFSLKEGEDRNIDVLLSPYESNKMCGMLKKLGLGRVCAITCDYPAESRFYDKLYEELSIKPSLYMEGAFDGVYLTRSDAGDGCELIYIINLDSYKKTIRIIRDNKVLFDKFILFEKASYILPLNLKENNVEIVTSSAELCGIGEDYMKFRLSQPKDTIVLKTDRSVMESEDYEIFENQGTKEIHSKKHALLDDTLTVKFI